ncbi:hypothetical protein FRB90_012412 [Tulasnella sp. 427]|nr:hypothetical protein FRB90_012412 [Tulasnella sp. 427]
MSFKSSPDNKFISEVPDAYTIYPDKDILEWTYFHCYMPGLKMNVPIPLHPKFKSTPFYSHMSYLSRCCTPFQHAAGLEGLKEAQLLESFFQRDDLQERVRKALGRGRCVVFSETRTRSRTSNDSADGDVQHLGELTLGNLAIDAQEWPEMIKTTLDEAITQRTNPTLILNLLDINAHSDAGIPAGVAGIYDDLRARRRVIDSTPATIADILRYPQWYLFGHPFAHSFIHNDTTGLSTYMTLESGVKLWFVLVWVINKVTPNHIIDRFKKLKRASFFDLEYFGDTAWCKCVGSKWIFDLQVYTQGKDDLESSRVARWECVVLKPGITLLMPPVQPHFVYKPKTCFGTGGHGLLWEAMHLTEIGCLMDNMADNISNDYHASMHLIHLALALELPEDPQVALNSGRTKLELAAIVRLCLSRSNYVQYRNAGETLNSRQYVIRNPELEEKAKTLLERYRDKLNIQLEPQSTDRLAAFACADFMTV